MIAGVNWSSYVLQLQLQIQQLQVLTAITDRAGESYFLSLICQMQQIIKLLITNTWMCEWGGAPTNAVHTNGCFHEKLGISTNLKKFRLNELTVL